MEKEEGILEEEGGGKGEGKGRSCVDKGHEYIGEEGQGRVEERGGGGEYERNL